MSQENNINWSLLEVARNLRMCTQKSVSEATGISQAALSKAERDIQPLSEEAFVNLCRYYDMPIDFFCQQSNAPLGHLYFRRKLTISDKVIDSFLAKVRIFTMIVDELTDGVELPEYDLENYRVSEESSPSDIADKIRYDLKIYQGAMPNMVDTLEAHGIIIIPFDFGTDKIDGLSTITQKNHVLMFINRTMPNDRIRYSMAHELGHIVMHLEHAPRKASSVEDEADEFASELLMPGLEMKKQLQDLRLDTLPILKKKWKVSMRALIRRAKDMECITEQQYRNFQIYFSKHGYNKREPINLPAEVPAMWKDILSLYKEEWSYTDQQLMNIMHVNDRDYKQWVTPWPRIIDMQRMM